MNLFKTKIIVIIPQQRSKLAKIQRIETLPKGSSQGRPSPHTDCDVNTRILELRSQGQSQDRQGSYHYIPSVNPISSAFVYLLEFRKCQYQNKFKPQLHQITIQENASLLKSAKRGVPNRIRKHQRCKDHNLGNMGSICYSLRGRHCHLIPRCLQLDCALSCVLWTHELIQICFPGFPITFF